MRSGESLRKQIGDLDFAEEAHLWQWQVAEETILIWLEMLTFLLVCLKDDSTDMDVH
jgi:hypothetical protein